MAGSFLSLRSPESVAEMAACPVKVYAPPLKDGGGSFPFLPDSQCGHGSPGRLTSCQKNGSGSDSCHNLAETFRERCAFSTRFPLPLAKGR